MHRLIVNCLFAGLASIFVAVGARADEEQQSQTSNRDAVSSSAVNKNWPSFRGANGLGHAAHARPPVKWNGETGAGILWKIVLPKHGMSSPVVWEDRVFLTGADEDSRQLYCVDAGTGKLLWHHDVTGVPGFPDDGTGSRSGSD